MSRYVDKAGLKVHQYLNDLLNNEILPGLDLDADQVWQGFSQLVNELAPVNRELLAKRDEIQKKIDAWHIQNPGTDKTRPTTYFRTNGYVNLPKERTFQHSHN